MLSNVTRQQVQREIQIQGRLAHDHIAQLVRLLKSNGAHSRMVAGMSCAQG